MPWVDENGELSEDCPSCAAAWVQVEAMERERRSDRAARSKAEKALEHAAVAKRDGAAWKRVLAAWLEAFPDKKPSAVGVKSARATKFFLRLEAGATVEDVELAIVGAKAWPYVVYGKRQRTGSRSDLADDLEAICAINRDAEFDFLVAAGRDT